MPTTTTVWKWFEDINNYSEEERATVNNRHLLIEAKLTELRGTDVDNLVSETTDSTANTKTVIRTWPDSASATSYVEYIVTQRALSSQINPE